MKGNGRVTVTLVSVRGQDDRQAKMGEEVNRVPERGKETR